MAVIKGGFEIVKRAMLKELMKRGDDGIMLTLPKKLPAFIPMPSNACTILSPKSIGFAILNNTPFS